MAGRTVRSMAAPAPVPALPDLQRRTQAVLTASVGPVDVGFALYGDGADYTAWIEVYVNGTITTDYVLSSPSGSISALARPITDARITFNTAQTGTVQISGARRSRRTAQFTENQGVPARDLNQVLTDIIATQREEWDLRSRLIRGIPGDTFPVLTPSARATTVVGFDASGNLVAYPVGSSVVLTGGATFDTRGLAQLATIAGGTQFVQTMGFAAVGDGGGASYIKTGGSTPGGFQSADGQWWQIFGTVFDVRQFGAKADGVTFADAAIDAADNAAVLAGVKLLFSGGTFAISAALTPRATAHWVGAGQELTTLSPTSTTATAISIVHDSVIIEDMRVVFPNVRISTSVSIDIDTPGVTEIRRVTIYNGGKNIRLGNTVSNLNAKISDVSFIGTVLNGNDFDVFNAAVVSIINCISNQNPAARPFAFLIARNVAGQLHLHNNKASQHQLGVSIIPGTGQSVSSLQSQLCHYDSMGSSGWQIAPTGTGSVVRCQSTDDSFTGAAGVGIIITAAAGAVASGIAFTDADVFGNGGAGLSATGVGISYLMVNGGQYSGNVGQGINFTNMIGGSIVGAQVNANTAGGVLLAGTTDHVTVVGNTVRDNSFSQISNTSTGAFHVIANNNVA